MTSSTEQRLVEALADVLVPELVRRGIVFAPSTTLATGPGYDAGSCTALAHEMGDNPLVAGEAFFGVLAKKGEVGAVEVAKLLGLDRTPIIAFVLTTPWKRVATRLGLPWPFDTDRGTDGRTVWRDYDGIASKMLDAIRAEKQRRGL